VTPTTPPLTDPVALIEGLESRTIRERLADLDEQSRALRVLLRAAVARERAAARRQTAAAAGEGVSSAS
jgi:hypothetical protein